MRTDVSEEPHPDDFMLVNIDLKFCAKVNPDVVDPPPVDVCQINMCLPADDATADLLEEIADAIRQRRLFGFVMQESAALSVGTNEWIRNTAEDMAHGDNVVSFPEKDKET